MIKLTKNDLRKEAKEIRKSLDMKKISEKIVAKIRCLDIYKNSQNIMLFYPLKNEMNLLPLLEDEKNFYLPRINGEDMEVCPYKLGDKMSISGFKTQEPTAEPINPEILDIIFIPALMVDKNLHRLGYGKGFYDRFLSKIKLNFQRIDDILAKQYNTGNIVKIVPIPTALITDNLPADEFDQKVDIIISEKAMI